ATCSAGSIVRRCMSRAPSKPSTSRSGRSAPRATSSSGAACPGPWTPRATPIPTRATSITVTKHQKKEQHMSIQIIVTPDSLMSIFEDGKFVGRVGLAYDQPVNDPQALVDLFTQG